jgi:hypothetical protein
VAGGEGNFSFDNSNAQAADRLVIKNGDLMLVVADPPASLARISKLADEMNGFVVTANQYMTSLENGVEVPEASITIRVPAERLNEALDRIRAESDRAPLSEKLGSEDVTKDYTDLQSRLRSLSAAEAQLTEIMGSATKTEDVLNVYNQLQQVQMQIEQVKGQIQYYEQSAALSAISVTLRANEAVQPLTIGAWQPTGVAKNAVQALINTLKVIVNIVIWTVILILPVLLILWLVFVLPIRWLWRTYRKRNPREPRPPRTPTVPPVTPPAQ